MFNAYGIHGQQIHVDPGRGLVIAINSAAPDANFTRELIAARVALFDTIRAAIDAERRRASARP
jgi:CubicO group peptidase (beta-lactamase class C family)